MRLPFDYVLAKSEVILKGVILCSANPEDDYYDEYISFLHECGWNEVDFDVELLKRIDNEFLSMWRKAHIFLC
jgi:hypothetical protein